MALFCLSKGSDQNILLQFSPLKKVSLIFCFSEAQRLKQNRSNCQSDQYSDYSQQKVNELIFLDLTFCFSEAQWLNQNKSNCLPEQHSQKVNHSSRYDVTWMQNWSIDIVSPLLDGSRVKRRSQRRRLHLVDAKMTRKLSSNRRVSKRLHCHSWDH